MPHRYALLVGTSRYTDAGLKQLLAPAQDTERLARALRDPAIGGFEVLPPLLNQNAADVREAVEETLMGCERDDLIVLYFSGHGIKDFLDGHLYLAATNTRLNLLESTAVSAEFINKVMLRSPARQQVLLLDCCYSGAFARGMAVKSGDSVNTLEHFSEADAGQGRVIITASDAMQYALEGQAATGVGRQSVFTQFVAEGLETGGADLDGDGLIEPRELYDYVSRRLKEAGHPQRPNGIFAQVGRLFLARNPRPPAPKPKPLPRQLQDAIDSDDIYRLLGAMLDLAELLAGTDAGLALSAQRALEVLRDHDSRRVSQAAAQALARVAAPRPTPPSQPAHGPARAEAIERTPEAPPKPDLNGWLPQMKFEPLTPPGAAESGPRAPAAGRHILGIDLGTSKTIAAVFKDGQPVLIPSADGETSVLSVVAINSTTGERLVGKAARTMAAVVSGIPVFSIKIPFYSIKRLMGRKYGDAEVQRAVQGLPYEVSAAPNGDARVHMGAKGYSPPEVSAVILSQIRADAEAYLGEAVTQAVITVPACFNDLQRQATKDAGRIAGLEVLRIVNEPTASALAYGLGKNKSETIAVYDLGGGKFDCSIVSVGDGVFEVKATSGDNFLGGDDFDQRIIDYVAEEFRRDQGIDVRLDRLALQRLREAAARVKIELSTVAQTEINLPFITADASGPKHVRITLTRSKLEQLTDDLIQRSIEIVRQALKDAGLEPAQVDTLVLVGGMTRMPAVRAALRHVFDREPHKGVNPDEVVALGAAIQAGVLAGEITDVLLLDVTPLSLSIETQGGVATHMIERNTTIPTRKSEVFSTAEDRQTSVEIRVVQGEHPKAAENVLLGNFIFDGIPPAPRGAPQIEVTFEIDADGILKVAAVDKATGRSQHVTVAAASGLSEDEIARMLQTMARSASPIKKR